MKILFFYYNITPYSRTKKTAEIALNKKHDRSPTDDFKITTIIIVWTNN